MDRALLSAPFKRDYVTFFALALFIATIIAELALIVWLPIQLRSEYLWDEEVALQKMIQLGDDLRGQFEHSEKNAVNNRQKKEINLAVTQLDDLARYIRKYHLKLNRDQVMDIYNLLQQYAVCRKHFADGKQFSHVLELNSAPVLEHLFSSIDTDSPSTPETTENN
ncbi:MAG: hypothetical protein JXR78_01920 [Victivallales bacterium]|nr:hypothetical protein [Victivallales bacterium]